MEVVMSASTTVTFRIDPEVKKGAEQVFVQSAKSTYTSSFWDLFGAGKDLDIDVPEELDPSLDITH